MTVALTRFVCCGGPELLESFVEPALFFHGWYGESRRTTRTSCRCGVVLAVTVTSTRPGCAIAA